MTPWKHGGMTTNPESTTGRASLPRLSPTPRSTPNRDKHRTVFDRQALYEILDEALFGHLGVVVNDSPLVIPTAYGRDGDTVFMHGSTGAQSMRGAANQQPVCFTVSILDGLVYGRAAFNGSMNYRCAIIHGLARSIVDPEEKLAGLKVLFEHATPQHWDHVREPNSKELAQTALIALPLHEASVKIRLGPPNVQDQDRTDTRWAGVLPLHIGFGTPVPTPLVPADVLPPDYVTQRRWPEMPPGCDGTDIQGVLSRP